MGTQYLLGNGRAAIAKRSATGVPGEIFFTGNCPELTFSFNVDKIEHFESESGQNLLDLSLIKTKRGQLAITLEEAFKQNIILMTSGSGITGAAATAINESIDITGNLKAGASYKLGHANVDTITSITPATGTAWVAGTDYKLDKDLGIITTLTLRQTTESPIAVVYSTLATSGVAFFTQPQMEFFVYFKGLNKAQSNKRFEVEFYRVTFDPVQDFSLISEDVAKFKLTGNILSDDARSADVNQGPFGKWQFIDPVSPDSSPA